MQKTALVNGRIHTSQGVAEALLIASGRIEAIGSSSDFEHSAENIVDLKGRAVFPGFSDSHMHFIFWAQSQETLDLTRCKTLEDLRSSLRRFMEETPRPEGGWLHGQGWDDTVMGREPTRYDLDDVAPDFPVYLRRVCEHVAVANTAALELAGITRDTHVEGGTIEKDADGEPTGILRENAKNLVWDRVPKLKDADIARLFEKYGPRAASYGLTELNSDDLTFFDFDFRRANRFFTELAEGGKLSFRLRRQMRLPHPELLKDFLSDGWRSGDGTPMCQVGSLKLITDGSLGGRTAFLNTPYANAREERGLALFSQKELDELVFIAHSSGMQVALHAIGDGALEMCLNAFERAQTLCPMLTRHQIVHAQVADDRQLARMKTLRLGAAIQPCFAPSDSAMAVEHLGPERAEKSYRWRTMLRKGLILAAGSDAPIETLRPMQGIHAAVTRSTPEGEPKGGWLPKEKLSVAEAISLYTWGGAWAGGNERRRGEIAVGRDADLAVLEQDPFAVPVSDLGKIEVAMTFCGGRVTHAMGCFSR